MKASIPSILEQVHDFSMFENASQHLAKKWEIHLTKKAYIKNYSTKLLAYERRNKYFF